MSLKLDANHGPSPPTSLHTCKTFAFYLNIFDPLGDKAACMRQSNRARTARRQQTPRQRADTRGYTPAQCAERVGPYAAPLELDCPAALLRAKQITSGRTHHL